MHIFLGFAAAPTHPPGYPPALLYSGRAWPHSWDSSEALEFWPWPHAEILEEAW